MNQIDPDHINVTSTAQEVGLGFDSLGAPVAVTKGIWLQCVEWTEADSELQDCAIEALGHFMTGKQDDNGDSFKYWLRHLMPDWHKTAANGVRIQDWLWDSARNGMAHQLAFKSGGTEAHDDKKFVVGKEGQIEMNPFLFYADFKVAVDRYFEALKKNVRLQTPF